MRIYVTRVFVPDQLKALAFYTDVLGFVEKTRVPVGEHFRLTVVSAQDPEGCQLLLEPDAHPAANAYKQALAADGIPAASFAVDDVPAEYERLRALGVEFVQQPTEYNGIGIAVFDDTCGNLIQIISQ